MCTYVIIYVLLVLFVLMLVERLVMVTIDALTGHLMLVLQPKVVAIIVRVAILRFIATAVLRSVMMVLLVARIGQRHADGRGENQKLHQGRTNSYIIE